jgi:hypothetical protein
MLAAVHGWLRLPEPQDGPRSAVVGVLLVVATLAASLALGVLAHLGRVLGGVVVRIAAAVLAVGIGGLGRLFAHGPGRTRLAVGTNTQGRR